MPSKHASPAKRRKTYRAPPGQLIPMLAPTDPAMPAKSRDALYVMLQKLHAGQGYFEVVRCLGTRLNIAKHLNEKHFQNADAGELCARGLAALIQAKMRLDQDKRGRASCSDAEAFDIQEALNVADDIEAQVTRQEHADAARYVIHAEKTGANLVRR